MKEFGLIKLPAFAKINWFLRVLGKREDDFHEICTAFQTISLADELTFAEADAVVLSSNDPAMPTDEGNIIIRAANLLRKRYRIEKGAAIHLEKRIPSPGGLGGGSSDCAVALMALAKLWNINITKKELCEIGESLGADVPFFFSGGTALGIGKGAEISEIGEIDEKFMLLVTPDIDVSTPLAFAQLNASRLTNSEPKRILKLCCDEAEKLSSPQSSLKNDFESIVFEIYPEVRRVKEKLISLGAKRVSMSGSGASVFGIFENEETRQATLKAIHHELNWRMFAVATISREKYREALESVFEVVSD